MKTIEINITGMTCMNCVKHARTALLGVPGVVDANVSLDPGKAIIQSEDNVEIDSLKEALSVEGYVGSPA